MSPTFSQPFQSPAKSPTGHRHVSGDTLPRTGLDWYVRAPGMVDIRGLSISDYDLIGSTWQPVFFTDPTTPIVFADYSALWSAVSAVPSFNEENVMGSETIGVAVYRHDTERSTLNKALRYFRQYLFIRYTDIFNYTEMENYA